MCIKYLDVFVNKMKSWISFNRLLIDNDMVNLIVDEVAYFKVDLMVNVVYFDLKVGCAL